MCYAVLQKYIIFFSVIDKHIEIEKKEVDIFGFQFEEFDKSLYNKESAGCGVSFKFEDLGTYESDDFDFEIDELMKPLTYDNSF